MKKLFLLLTVLLSISCGENKYGVTNGLLTPPHFPQEQVEQTIIKALGCETCIKSIEYPNGYPINTPRVLRYTVVFEREGELLIKRYYIGKVLKLEEKNNEQYLKLVE